MILLVGIAAGVVFYLALSPVKHTSGPYERYADRLIEIVEDYFANLTSEEPETTISSDTEVSFGVCVGKP